MPSPLDAIVQEMPDNRGAQRLVTALEKLERYVADMQVSGGQGSGSLAAKSEVLQLRTQNRKLKTKQRQAAERLDALMQRLAENPVLATDEATGA